MVASLVPARFLQAPGSEKLWISSKVPSSRGNRAVSVMSRQWIMSAEDGRLIPNRWDLPRKSMVAGMQVEKLWISAQDSLDSMAT